MPGVTTKSFADPEGAPKRMSKRDPYDLICGRYGAECRFTNWETISNLFALS